MKNKMYVFSIEDGMVPRGNQRMITLAPVNCEPYRFFGKIEFQIPKESFGDFELGAEIILTLTKEEKKNG